LDNRPLDLNNLTIESSELLNQIYISIKDEYLEMINNIYDEIDESIDWLVNSVLSRNNHLSNILLDICYVLLVKELTIKRKFSSVTVLNPAQQKVLKNYYFKKKINIPVICPNYFKQIISESLAITKSFLINILLSCRYLCNRNKKRSKKILTDITLIDTFIIKSMYNEGELVDRYYNGLIRNIPKELNNKLYFLPTISSDCSIKNVVNICQASDRLFIYKFDYLTIQDYLFSLVSPFRIKRINLSLYKIRGLNIGPILKSDFSKNISNNSSFEGILNYLFFLRLKKKHVSIRLVINWFENQVIDRGFNMGLNSFFPNTNVIGYQGLLASYNYNFHLQPTNREYESKVIPSKIAVLGGGIKKNIEEFCDQVDTILGPAFRFNGIFDRKLRRINTSKKILITLNNIKIENEHLLRMLLDYNEKFHSDGIYLDIKPHPTNNINELKNILPYWPKQFKIINKDKPIYFDNYRILISNASSTCLEALAYGVSVIVIEDPWGITKNPIPDEIPMDYWSLCYTSKELNEAINSILEKSSKKDSRDLFILSQKIKSEYFTPVSKNSVMTLLDLI